jgi:hypothetical protein
MDAQRIAVDAVVALTDCDREQIAAFIRRLYLAGVKDPKRLTFKGLQARRGADGQLGLKPISRRQHRACPWLVPMIHVLPFSLRDKDVDGRVTWREDARSLSSGRALRGPVGAFARP